MANQNGVAGFITDGSDENVTSMARLFAGDIVPERLRQIAAGYTNEHDDDHDLLTLEEAVHKYVERAFDARMQTGNHDMTEWRRRMVQAITVGCALVLKHDRRQERIDGLATNGVEIDPTTPIAPTPMVLPAGWGWPMLAKKAHYYEQGQSQSACGRWWFTGEREDDKDDHADNCAACRKRIGAIRKRQQKAAQS